MSSSSASAADVKRPKLATKLGPASSVFAEWESQEEGKSGEWEVLPKDVEKALEKAFQAKSTKDISYTDEDGVERSVKDLSVES